MVAAIVAPMPSGWKDPTSGSGRTSPRACSPRPHLIRIRNARRRLVRPTGTPTGSVGWVIHRDVCRALRRTLCRAKPRKVARVILRVVHCRVPARHSHLVFEHARRLYGPDVPDGLLHVAVGRQQEGATDAFVLASEWRDLEALYRWVGGRELLRATPSLGPLTEIATDIDIQHYEGPEADENAAAGAAGAARRPVEADEGIGERLSA